MKSNGNLRKIKKSKTENRVDERKSKEIKK
jgi:hypothetical protein